MPPPVNPQQYRLQAIRLYKELHRLGREYPDEAYGFNARIRRWFERNRTLTEEEDIKKALAMAEYIRDETMALYSLKKFRHLRRAYHADEPPR